MLWRESYSSPQNEPPPRIWRARVTCNRNTLDWKSFYLKFSKLSHFSPIRTDKGSEPGSPDPDPFAYRLPPRTPQNRPRIVSVGLVHTTVDPDSEKLTAIRSSLPADNLHRYELTPTREVLKFNWMMIYLLFS